MGDAVGSMLRESKPVVSEPSNPLVTVIVKYDIFPRYRVHKGRLQDDGTVRVEAGLCFRADSVLRVLPASRYEEEKARLDRIEADYDENERQLRIDILKANRVDFVSVK